MRPGATCCGLTALALMLALPPTSGHWALWPQGAAASTFIDLSVGELAARSTAIVAGTPLDHKTVWESAGGARSERIVTYTRVRVDKVFSGSPAGEIWVRTLGGQVGDIGQIVEGEAVLVQAQPALMFLQARADGTHSVVGMGQGHYPLETLADASLRISHPGALGNVLAPKAPSKGAHRPARLVLPGRRLDELTQIIASERGAHAP
jgi:hypothetical protein